MNSILKKESKSCCISGEIYFNDAYSLNLDIGAESENQLGLNREVRKIGSHFRWYFMQEDCNCSAFFAGPYFSIVREHQSVDKKFLNNNAVSYTASSLEGGLSVGYQALLAGHFVIDPSVQTGMKLTHYVHGTENINVLTKDNESGVLVQISLGIGYRF